MKTKLILISLLVPVVTFFLVFGFVFWKNHRMDANLLRGNRSCYAVASVSRTDSPLLGKKFIFLGSSVTDGACSHGESFVDFLEKKDGIAVLKKEAVSGTTLVNQNDSSYIPRMLTLSADLQPDCFVCQLSTNDSSLRLPLGDVSSSFDKNSFDTNTVAGAVEYIIAYASETWHCPIVFFTNPKYDSDDYAASVRLLYRVREKWNIGIVDLWGTESMNLGSQNYPSLYMADAIHPTRAGYRDLWTPVFEAYFTDLLCD